MTTDEYTDQPEQRFEIPARSTRGWVLGVTGRQLTSLALGLALLAGGVYLARLWTIAAGIVLAGVVVCLAWMPLGGRKLGDWLPIMVSAAIRRALGWNLFRGGPFVPGGLSRDMALPGDLAACQWVHALAADGVTPIGLVYDCTAKTYTACLPTYGSAFALEESAVQAARLDDWESVLESFADADAGLVRWQLMTRSRPDTGNKAQRYMAEQAVKRETDTARSLEALNASAAPSSQRHETYLVLTYSQAQLGSVITGAKATDEEIVVALVEELMEIEQAVREAQIDVDPDGWMSAARYAAVIKSQFDPDSLPLFDLQAHGVQGFDERNAGPTGAEAAWAHYRHDSAVSQTVWVHGLPRLPVRRNWLAPVLQQNSVRRTISLVAEPLPESRAQRYVSREQAERAGNEMLRQHLGFGETGRSQSEGRGVAVTASQLSTGSPLFRYHLFVTVSAADLAELRRDMVTIRRRLTRAHCHGMPLYGEMDQAFFAGALPLARGLAPMRGIVG